MPPRCGRRRRRKTSALLLAACVPGGAAFGPTCGPRFYAPPEVPQDANRYNGVAVEACFYHGKHHHVFVIGDWGGEGDPPKPADRRGDKFVGNARQFVHGVDNRAQQRVAHQMAKRAFHSNPDYVLNVGDNFYWGGIQTQCGARPYDQVNTGQWGPVFETVYTGPGLDNKQWLGVLGNHDYGGFTFSAGWDQAIGYTWGGPPPCTKRWFTPAQYYAATVGYPGFTVDYFFLDTNVFAVSDPRENPDHNICSAKHTPNSTTCGDEGPKSVWECPQWFRRLWRDQVEWLNKKLADSTADWQVCVTHFPPTFGRAGWERLVERHHVDLIITGHIHQQEVHYMEDANFLRPTAWIVSGGGGGITSEGQPHEDGDDDQYGFFDLQLSKKEIVIDAISHGGQVRSTTKVVPRTRDSARSPTTTHEPEKERVPKPATSHLRHQDTHRGGSAAKGDRGHEHSHDDDHHHHDTSDRWPDFGDKHKEEKEPPDQQHHHPDSPSSDKDGEHRKHDTADGVPAKPDGGKRHKDDALPSDDGGELHYDGEEESRDDGRGRDSITEKEIQAVLRAGTNGTAEELIAGAGRYDGEDAQAPTGTGDGTGSGGGREEVQMVQTGGGSSDGNSEVLADGGPLDDSAGGEMIVNEPSSAEGSAVEDSDTAYAAANNSLDYVLFVAGCVAPAALGFLLAFLFGALRSLCRRPRKDPKASMNRGWASSGYSGYSGLSTAATRGDFASVASVASAGSSPGKTQPLQTRAGGGWWTELRQDGDETVLEDHLQEHQEEYVKPGDLGCFCWPNRSRNGGHGPKYMLLQPA